MLTNWFEDTSSSALKTRAMSLNSKGIHNFCYGLLDSYFQINKLASVGKVSFKFNETAIFIVGLPGKFRKKLFVYDASKVDQFELESLHVDSLIYSIDQLNLSKIHTFKEIGYDLKQVFDPASYANSKKRYQRLKYPFQFIAKEKMGIGIATHDDLPEITRLHSDWVDAKLADPRTFKMMFPCKRYLRCVEFGLRDTDYKVMIAKDANDKIVATRVVFIQGTVAYDLAFFSRFWDLPSQVVTYLNIIFLKHFFDEGITLMNCGAAGNKNLHASKAHYPCCEIVSYMYSSSGGTNG